MRQVRVACSGVDKIDVNRQFIIEAFNAGISQVFEVEIVDAAKGDADLI